MTGIFISCEGVDGSGKSTQVRLLVERLQSLGREVVHTREPGGSPGAEEIRRLLVEGEPGRWSPEVETLLFKAARRDHIERTVQPALERGAVVISDRYVDSTRAYQAQKSAAARALVDDLHKLAIQLDPHLTIILDIDPDDAYARAMTRAAQHNEVATRFEKKGLGFQHELRRVYREIAAAEPARCALIPATGSEQEVAEKIWATVTERLPMLAAS